MSSDIDSEDDDPTGLEDEPVDCFNHLAIVDIILPQTGQTMQTVDIEVVADRELSNAELEARVRAQIQPWLDTLSQSPKFKARTGNRTEFVIVGGGVTRGC